MFLLIQITHYQMRKRHQLLIFDVWLEGLQCDRCSLCAWGSQAPQETFVDAGGSGELRDSLSFRFLNWNILWGIIDCILEVREHTGGRITSLFSQARDLFLVSLIDSNIDRLCF